MLPMQGSLVPSLMGKFRSLMPCSMAKRKKKKTGINGLNNFIWPPTLNQVSYLENKTFARH